MVYIIYHLSLPTYTQTRQSVQSVVTPLWKLELERETMSNDLEGAVVDTMMIDMARHDGITPHMPMPNHAAQMEQVEVKLSSTAVLHPETVSVEAGNDLQPRNSDDGEMTFVEWSPPSEEGDEQLSEAPSPSSNEQHVSENSLRQPRLCITDVNSLRQSSELKPFPAPAVIVSEEPEQRDCDVGIA